MDVRSYTANKIKEYRKLKGLTQKELGERVGVKHNTISGYENCTTEPEQNILFKIASVLEININDLFPPTTSKPSLNNSTAHLTEKDERDIQKRLQSILNDLNSDAALSFYNGDQEMDDETKELLKVSLEQSIRTAKIRAKEKFTPNKYKK